MATCALTVIQDSYEIYLQQKPKSYAYGIIWHMFFYLSVTLMIDITLFFQANGLPCIKRGNNEANISNKWTFYSGLIHFVFDHTSIWNQTGYIDIKHLNLDYCIAFCFSDFFSLKNSKYIRCWQWFEIGCSHWPVVVCVFFSRIISNQLGVLVSNMMLYSAPTNSLSQHKSLIAYKGIIFI